MALSKRQINILFGAGLVVIFLIILFAGVIPGFRQSNPADEVRGTLAVAGIGERENFENLIAAFKREYPQVTVNYVDLGGNYETNLVNLMAAGQAPDVFMFHRSWLPKHADKIIAAPNDVFSVSAYQAAFPQLAVSDFVSGGQVYAAPLFIDTLAMFYNRRIFDTQSVAIAPTSWNEFEEVARHLRVLDADGNVVSPGAALGDGSGSVRRSLDLMGVFTKRNGGSLSPNSRGNMDDAVTNGFANYVRFADARENTAVWDKKFGDSVDAFSHEVVPIMFDYRPVEMEIWAKNPNIDYVISPMLQDNANAPINYADYWGLAVSNQSGNQNLGWRFIAFATRTESGSRAFLSTSLHTPALRSLIQEKVGQGGVDGFLASQALTADAWRGYDLSNAQNVFDNMINLFMSGTLSLNQISRQLEEQLR